jgi:hypothetical protein
MVEPRSEILKKRSSPDEDSVVLDAVVFAMRR